MRNQGLLVWILSQMATSDKLNPVLVDIVVHSWKSASKHCTPDSGHKLPTPMLNQVCIYYFVISFLDSLPSLFILEEL